MSSHVDEKSWHIWLSTYLRRSCQARWLKFSPKYRVARFHRPGDPANEAPDAAKAVVAEAFVHDMKQILRFACFCFSSTVAALDRHALWMLIRGRLRDDLF